MNHFYQQFTIIDFLQMFLPGAITILSMNWCGVPLTDFWYAFFPEGILGISVYFIVMSYLAGHLLCQITKILERFSSLEQASKRLDDRYANAVTEKATALGLLNYLPENEENPENKENKENSYQSIISRRIYYYVLMNTDNKRLQLMRGFYGLCRTSIGATLIAGVCFGYKLRQYDPRLCIGVAAICVFLIVLLWFRAIKYRKIATETNYEFFLIYQPTK